MVVVDLALALEATALEPCLFSLAGTVGLAWVVLA